MPAKIMLHDLVHGISASVIEAQEQVVRKQIDGLRKFFLSDGTPVCVALRMPSPRRDSQDGYETLQVPLLALIPIAALQISEVAVDFEVVIKDLTDDPVTSANAAPGSRVGVTPPMFGAPMSGMNTEEPATEPEIPNIPNTGDDGDIPHPPGTSGANALHIGLDTSAPKGGGSTARVHLKIESKVPPEGVMRLAQRLNSLF